MSWPAFLEQQVSRIASRYERYSPDDLALSRQVFFVLFLLFGLSNFSVAANYDPELVVFPSLSPAYFIGQIPSAGFLAFLTVLNVGSALALVFNWRPMLNTVLFCLSYVIGRSFVYSYGKVDHYDIFIPVFPLVGMLAGWGQPVRKTFFPVAGAYFVMAFAIGLVFLTAGIPKLLTGWLSWQDQQVQYVVINYTYGIEQSHIGQWMLDTIHSAWAWEVLDWLAVGFECLLIVLIIKPHWFWWGLGACALFHLANFLMLGINFFPIFITYAALLPLSSLVRGIRRKRLAKG